MKTLPANKTKIVCTIGPASDSPEMLRLLIENGMNVARLNFAHGDFESHRKTIRNVRDAAVQVGRQVAIMGDLPGPKIRVGQLAEEPVILQRGKPFILHTEEIEGAVDGVSVNFPDLPGAVKPGDQIFINDGFILLEVESVSGQEIHCRVRVGGELRSNKGLNLPGIDLGISAFTKDDRRFLQFAAEHGLDAVSQSFVQGAHDIHAVRDAAAGLDFKPFIIAKIERGVAVGNLDAILAAADGIMVARGDLGVEIPIEEMAIIQKDIIHRANLAGKPVITATHMLESMTIHTRPTRAEATDVANAILDGTDCVMLSGETATGNFPAETVAVMCRIAAVTEPYCQSADASQALKSASSLRQTSKARRVSLSIYLSAEAIDPVAIVTPTGTGSTPRLITRFKLPVWIIAFCSNEPCCQSLHFSYGVYPVFKPVSPENWGQYAREWLRRHGFTHNLALLTYATTAPNADMTNHIEFIDLGHEPN